MHSTHEQELPHSTVGVEAPRQVLVQGPAPHWTAVPTHAAASHSIAHEPPRHWKLTSPQASTPSAQVSVQPKVLGQTIADVSQASRP